MEYIERLFGIKRRRQEKLLAEIEVGGKLKREFVGPEHEEASVVEIDNDHFLQILKSGEHEKVLSHLVHQSDTHQYHDLYIDIGEGILVKTGVASLDYSGQRNLFSDLHEMSFRYDPEESKDRWGVYRTERS